MKLAKTLEESLNGGYNGLYGEVVTCDMYHMRTLGFVPDLIFDIGANIGVFTRYARLLFPDAKIVAVEPDASNIAHFKKFTPPDPKIVLLEKALGQGQIYRCPGAVNGSGEFYASVGLGYKPEDTTGLKSVPVPALSLGNIVWPYWTPYLKTVMKIDCEGAENCLWGDADAMYLLKHMDFIALELHYHAADADQREKVVQATEEALTQLGQTHECSREHVYFWAKKRTTHDKTPL